MKARPLGATSRPIGMGADLLCYELELSAALCETHRRSLQSLISKEARAFHWVNGYSE